MGFFGGLWGKVKEVASKVVDTGKKVCGYVKEKVTNAWNSFTGKKTFDEAEQLFDEITEKYNRRRQQFDEDVDRITNLIEQHVDSINKSKNKIKSKLFVEMATNLEKIKDIRINRDFSIEEYKAAVLEFDTVRSKSELYKIDFNKHKFKTTVQAIFTLGFYTRKKAKETLYAVEEEELKINTEINKMDAEIIKLNAIEESLKNVEIYFTSLIEIYEQLLVRLDNSVRFLYFRCIQFAHKLVHKEMSLKRLPLIQQKEVEAIITSSKILKAMTEAKIVSLEEKSEVASYEKSIKSQCEEINKVYMIA